MYLVNKDRLEEKWRDSTGIYIRAQLPDGKWVSADLIQLEPESLLKWLRSGGNRNPLAENVVGILLGYGHITTPQKKGEEGNGT